MAELSVGGDAGWTSTRLCEVTRDITGVSGAGVMLMSGDVPRGSLCTTDAVSNLIEQHQAGRIDATDRIWRLLNLQLWGDLFITGKRRSWRDGLLTAASAR